MNPIYPYLTYAGALPFIFGTLCLWYGQDSLPLLGSVADAISAYAVIIASFLAGAHWGQHLHIKQTHWQSWLPIISNAMTVALWFSVIALPFHAVLLVSTAAFTALLAVDSALLSARHITAGYFKTRAVITTVVISCLTLSGVAV